MKRNFGIILMVFGALMLSAALVLCIYNIQEDKQAQVMTEHYLPKLIDSIQNNASATDNDTENADANQDGDGTDGSVSSPNFYYTELPVAVVDGQSFVGYISIPSLNLELPIISETDYEKLRIAPCLFSGSPKTDNLVIGAHNYSRHFGKIADLNSGDEIVFTDILGNVWKYSVIATEILRPSDVDILTNGEYDLTLFTCTYGGRTRVALRCDKAE